MTILMDGGMGGELSKRGAGAVDGLWSAQALLDAPEIVAQVHKDYIAAGARLIITNSYSTIPSYLAKGRLEERYEELTALAGQIARKAADESGEAVTVLGSLPPMSESYRADLAPDRETSEPIYRNMVKALLPHVDGFICETLSTADEALSASTAACENGEGKPVYVSWSLKEEPGKGLRSGESVTHAFKCVEHLPLTGFLFNCTHPLAVEEGLRELKALTDKPLGGYANTMTDVPEGWTLDEGHGVAGRDDGNPRLYAQAALRWQNHGATMIGGCCGTGPAHIAELHRRLTEPVSA